MSSGCFSIAPKLPISRSGANCKTQIPESEIPQRRERSSLWSEEYVGISKAGFFKGGGLVQSGVLDLGLDILTKRTEWAHKKSSNISAWAPCNVCDSRFWWWLFSLMEKDMVIIWETWEFNLWFYIRAWFVWRQQQGHQPSMRNGSKALPTCYRATAKVWT